MEQVACNLCGSWEAEELYPSTLDGAAPQADHFRCTSPFYGQHYRIVRCGECDLVYASPRPGAEEILHNYAEITDPTYLEESEHGRRLTFRRNFRPLARLFPQGAGGRLLDIGCYTGIFLEVAQEAGWEAWGVEPCLWAAGIAEKKGLRAEPKSLAEARFPEGFFYLVTMWDVIEHLADPLGELAEVRRVTKGGGVLAVHTIDIGSPFARALGERWPWLMEMHLYYFTRGTLSALLEKAGFQVLGARIQGRYLPLGYLASRLASFARIPSGGLESAVRRLGLEALALPVNFGDLFTMYARRA